MTLRVLVLHYCALIWKSSKEFSDQGLFETVFCVLRGRNSAHSQWNLGALFPNFEKIPILKKNNARTLQGDIILQFNGKSMCNFFLLTKNDIIAHY